MIVESDNMKKLRERNLLKEIKTKTLIIQDSPPRTIAFKEQKQQEDYEHIIDEIFGEE